MKLLIILSSIMLLVACSRHPLIKSEEKAQPMILTYPQVKKGPQLDNYHGVEVADPYRWLEDPHSRETQNWIAQQQQLTERYFAGLSIRDRILNRIYALSNYAEYSAPHSEAGKIFFFKNDGLQNQSVLYMQDSAQQTPRTLLDPNRFSEDGTMALTQTSVSPDGRILAYGVSNSGSDWEEWRFRNTETGRDLKDHLQWIKFSNVAWEHDGSGIYYARYDKPDAEPALQQQSYGQKLYFHQIGMKQKDDVLIYARPDEKEWGYSPQITEDGKYLVISIWQDTAQRNRIYYKRTDKPDNTVIKLLDRFDARYNFIGNQANIFYFQTNLHAPMERVIAIDITSPASQNWREIIPESKDAINAASIINKQLVITYMHDVLSAVSTFTLDGEKVSDIELPGPGSVEGFEGKMTDTQTYYTFSSHIQPPSLYRYDFQTKASVLFRKPDIRLNLGEFVSEQVFYTGKDGARIPMLVSWKKGMQKNSTNPTLLYAYGGFNISLAPSYSSADIVWMEAGGILAIPNLRGGGEYGEHWHAAGMFEKKQNVFDDFYAAAEYLIQQQYTSSKYLGIYGRSNGGLLIGAALTQRPDLFQVAIPAVGVMDMLRYQKFTIGWAWVSEYGSSDQADQFEYLIKYSPLHNVHKRHYPATLILTAEHDDRVVPLHSFKFGAAMQENQAGNAPIMMRIESKAGHGAGKPKAMKIAEKTDIYTFLLHNMNKELPGDFGAAETPEARKIIPIITD